MLWFKCSPGLLVGGIVLALVAADGTGSARKGTTQDEEGVAAAFARLKKLAGDWQLAAPGKESKEGVAVRYRVTAGQSAVVETIFPGTEHEMVTVYHRDGNQLILTHYCCCGNQPRMRARIGPDPNELVFEFLDGTNLDPAKDGHMHDCRIRFVDGNRLHTEWEYYDGGKAVNKHGFDLVRK